MKYTLKTTTIIFSTCKRNVLVGPNKLLMKKNRQYNAKFIKRHISRYKPAARIIIYNHYRILSDANYHSLSSTIDTWHSYSVEDTWSINTTFNVSCRSKFWHVYLCIHFVETVDHWIHELHIYICIKWTVFVNVTTKSAQHAHAPMIAIIVEKYDLRLDLSLDFNQQLYIYIHIYTYIVQCRHNAVKISQRTPHSSPVMTMYRMSFVYLSPDFCLNYCKWCIQYCCKPGTSKESGCTQSN